MKFLHGVALVALLAVGCSAGEPAPNQQTPEPESALGGSARTEDLASVTVDSVPSGPLVWRGFEVSGVSHAHGPSFVHATQGAADVIIDNDLEKLDEGSATFVKDGELHEHGEASAWDVVLMDPDDSPPSGVGREVFSSEVLDGIPSGPVEFRSFLVELPKGTKTSVHTHPGPEFIYSTGADFIYQNAIIGSVVTGEGEGHTLPPETAVQKRNPDSSGVAAFLSWFIVDPDERFAPAASFG